MDPLFAHMPWATQEMIADVIGGRGRVYLMNKYGITDHKAKTLIRRARERSTVDMPPEIRSYVTDLERQLDALRRESNPIKMMADAMSGAVRDLPKLSVPIFKKDMPDSELDSEDVVLVISDVHIGQWVDAEETGGLGCYNYEVFLRRMARLEEAVRRILRYMPNRTPRCHVFFLGDIVDGSTIFEGQLRQIEFPAARQTVYAYERFSQLIADLSGLFDEVVVSCVVGNHGRIGKKGVNSPMDNLDWLAYWFMRERFERSEIKNVRFNLADSWWMVVEVNGRKFLLSHGDGFKSWLGIPFYGATRYEGSMRKLMRDAFERDTRASVDFDYVVLGDKHSQAKFGPIFMNGSWPGGSEMSLRYLQAGGLPYQWMFGVHERQGISWERELRLESPHNMPQPKTYS